ncbi:biotin--[acetyl-CoA-carboxylase] ligase [Flavobacterium alkalisoli]|uniref:Biotin--[acetyl-CoA-carboxylase] ligase n=1 Tax=Flavobacterium alkalisoli TaxID=2602769 RepID=A0A5B9G1B9_9FLAO|nr:biotin--[acetyl-CoA-carboxylase] ligase [Flavobacterium alkalisoli]QEE51252.1 biotin--[acetyl-CoA-carboxylase] ligase [Flavobacterium alkalisoli]
MNIIKLNAINSTNDYLKTLSGAQYLENFTVVVAENQTKGKGQMGAKWNTAPGKNLTFSVLIKDLLLGINEIFNLNVAVAVSILQALEKHNVDKLSVKWPNDILAGNKKIGGILIENSIKNSGEIFSVVGIGLNVNQTDFEGLPKASSLAVVCGHEFDKTDVLESIVTNLKRNVASLLHKNVDPLWVTYHKNLYKKGVPMPFEKDDKKFMGIIQGVTRSGNLELLLEDDTMAEFKIKELQMLY